jgi:DnaJ-class molecular chaperone
MLPFFKEFFMGKWVRCPDCRGDGMIEIEGKKETCLSCGGKGYTLRSGGKVPCSDCKGRGKRGALKKCTTCDGLGFVPG